MTKNTSTAPKAAKKRTTKKTASKKATPEGTPEPKATEGDDPAPAPGSPKKANVTSATLADAARGYLERLEADGKSGTTILGYRMELRLAAKHLGEDTLLCELTPKKVQAFFDSPKVTKTRAGKKKAMPGVLKTRRVLRLCLVWAQEHGMIETAPLPTKAE